MKAILILFLPLLLASQQNLAQEKNKTDQIKDLEIPQLKKGEELIRHKGFSLVYNEAFEQASWVAYELTASETHGLFPRTNKFLPDPLIKTGTARAEDYLKSDLDRGHLAPAADMAWSSQSMKESFYYSNMSPQVPTFNRGIWEDAEELVRSWAEEYGSVYLASGPVLHKGLPAIGPDKVAIPEYYYKVILRYNGKDKKGIGIILKNGMPTLPLKSYFITIDSVEHVTGIDFFPKLPDNEESAIESRMSLSEWKWEGGKTSIKTNQGHSGVTEISAIAAVQCIAVTKKGSRCRNMTKNPNQRCWRHQ